MESIVIGCLFLVVYTLFIYPCVLAIITCFYTKKTQVDTSITPKVSLIIAAYNEEKDIEEKICNSLELDYPNLEIIIASDGSSDNTVPICKRYEDKITLYAREERSGKIGALNYVVPKAKGEILLFSDANTFYEPNAIKELVKHFHDQQVGCVTGYVRLIAKGREHEIGEGIFTRIERFIQIKETLIHSVIGLDGAMYALRKEFYDPLSNYFIEDFVMGMNIIKKGYRVIYDPRARGKEASSDNLQDEFKRKSRIVAGGFQSLSMMGFLLKRPCSLFMFVSHKLLRWVIAELLLIAFVLNIFLLDNLLFRYLFYLQIMVYGMGVAGYFLRPLSFVFYFFVMQAASLWGVIKYFFNIQKVTWKKVKRV